VFDKLAGYWFGLHDSDGTGLGRQPMPQVVNNIQRLTCYTDPEQGSLMGPVFIGLGIIVRQLDTRGRGCLMGNSRRAKTKEVDEKK